MFSLRKYNANQRLSDERRFRCTVRRIYHKQLDTAHDQRDRMLHPDKGMTLRFRPLSGGRGREGGGGGAPPPSGETGSHEITSVNQFVSMSVSNHVSSKTAHIVFLKLHMRLECLKGKKRAEAGFCRKELIWGKTL